MYRLIFYFLIMKKYFILVLFILNSFVLTSCFENPSEVNNHTPPPDNSQQTDISPQDNNTQDTNTMSWTEDAKSTFDSLNDAASKWLSLKCIYKDSSDNSETTVYIKGDNILMFWDNSGSSETWINGVIKWDVIYMWNNGEWLKLNLSTSPKDSVKIWKQSIKSQADLLDIINSQKDGCIQEDIPDSKFQLPNGVEFKELPDSGNNASGN